MSDPFRVPSRVNPRRHGTFGDGTPQIYVITPSRGLFTGGTSVTITGANFHYDSDGITPPIVMFGTEQATSVVVVSANTITAVTPAVTEVDVVDVTVTEGTATATLIGGFTYYAPTIVSVDPAFGPIAGSTDVILNGYNFDTTATYIVQFGGSNATDVAVIDAQTIFATTPNHAVGRVDVVLLVLTTEHARLRNGFQYTLLTRGEDIRRMPGISIRDTLNNAPNDATFSIDGTSNVPLVGEKIEILDEQDGDRRLFAGNVQSVTQEFEDQTDQIVWRTRATDFTWLLNKYRPFGVYKNVSVSNIVKNLALKFAPGFTTNHVQTKLARASVTFDGSKDFSTCLNLLAQAIGAGHWYVDYDQDIHFFHRLPTNIIIPQTAGPITAMTVAEGTVTPGVSYTLGYYMFRSTNVFDNGVESALGPFSNCVALQGTSKIVFTNVPVGTTIGTHVVASRRIYFYLVEQGVILPLERFAEIANNTTTGFTWDGTAFSDPDVSALADNVLPIVNRTIPPPGPIVAPGVELNSTVYVPPFPPFGSVANPVAAITRGRWAFKVSHIYRDGSESFPSPSSGTVDLEGSTGALLTGIPVGPTIEGNDVVARKVFASYGPVTQKSLNEVVNELQASKNAGTLVEDWAGIIGISDSQYLYTVPIPTNYHDLAMIIGFGDLDYLLNEFQEPDWSPERTSMWFLLNDNTTTTANVGPGMGAGLPLVDTGVDPEIPTWPNADGPSLEDDDPPDEITDDDPDLCHDPSFKLTTDQSQIRNRVYIVGAGSSLSEKGIAGDNVLKVPDLTIYNPQGGELLAGGYRLLYRSLSGTTGGGSINLKSPLPVALEQGIPINIFFQADDLPSQRERAKAELDTNGLPTDGVHEYMVVDTTLRTQFALYMRAYAELELFALPIQKIVFSSRNPKMKSGQIVSVDMTDPPCVGEFLIQDVTIDQIHDESDQLMPRYNVSASSVKFDLEDLLLALLGGGSVISGNSGIGTSAFDTAVGQVDATGFIPLFRDDVQPRPEGRGVIPRPPLRAYGAYQCSLGEATPFPVKDGIASSVTILIATGTHGGFEDDGIRLFNLFQDSAGEQLRIQGGTAHAFTQLEFDPFIETVLRFRAATNTPIEATDCSFWFVLGNTPGTPWPDQADNSARKGIGFRFDKAGGDTTIRPWYSNGTTQVLGSQLGITLAEDTTYTLSINVTGGGAFFQVWINGIVSGLIPIPATILATGMTWFINYTGGGPAAYFLNIASMYLERN